MSPNIGLLSRSFRRYVLSPYYRLLKPGDLGLWRNSYLVVVEVTLGHALWEAVATASECCFLAIDAQVVHKVVTQKVVVGTKIGVCQKMVEDCRRSKAECNPPCT